MDDIFATIFLFFVVLIAFATGIGIAHNKEAIAYKNEIHKAITLCEESLPRDKNCKYVITAEPM